MTFVGIILRIALAGIVIAFIFGGSRTARKKIIVGVQRILDGETKDTLLQRLLVGTLLFGVTSQTCFLLWSVLYKGWLTEVNLLGLLVGLPITYGMFMWYKYLHINIRIDKEIAKLSKRPEQKGTLLLHAGEQIKQKDQLKEVSNGFLR